MSNSLRFNATDMDLWEICIYYEFEIRQNPFKSRKMFMKCLRLNNDNLDAWLRYLKFEAKFIKRIEKREELFDHEDGAKADEDAGFLTFEEDDNSKILT
jgi:hypothetical protein